MKSFVLSILRPFRIIPTIKAHFFIWLVFVIIISHIGIILSIQSCLYNGSSFKEAFSLNFNSGNFYGIGIPLCSSYIAAILSEILVKKAKVSNFEAKIVSLCVLIILIFFMASNFSMNAVSEFKIQQVVSSGISQSSISLDQSSEQQSNDKTSTENENKTKPDHNIDIKQLILYIFSILLVAYVYCLTNDEGETYKEDNDAEVAKLKKSSKGKNNDGEGMIL